MVNTVQTMIDPARKYWEEPTDYRRFHPNYDDREIIAILSNGSPEARQSLQADFEARLPPLFREYQAPTNDSLLDLGCAGGWNLQFFRDKFTTCHGIDIAENWVDLAKARTNGDIQYQTGDIAALNKFVDQSLDVVLFNNMFHILFPYRRLVTCFDKIKRLLKPDGRLLFSTPVLLTNNWLNRPIKETLQQTEADYERLKHAYDNRRLLIIGKGALGRQTGAQLDNLFQSSVFQNEGPFLSSNEAKLHNRATFVIAGTPEQEIIKALEYDKVPPSRFQRYERFERMLECFRKPVMNEEVTSFHVRRVLPLCETYAWLKQAGFNLVDCSLTIEPSGIRHFHGIFSIAAKSMESGIS